MVYCIISIRSENVGVVSCVPQGIVLTVLCPLLFLLYLSDLLIILENTLEGYADELMTLL